MTHRLSQEIKAELGVNGDAPSLKLLRYADLVSEQDPLWLVEGWLAQLDIAVLFGPTGSYKSFVALDLVHSLATGRAWQGVDVEPTPAIYVAGEGGTGIAKRVRAWAELRGCPDDARYLRSPVRLDDDGESLKALIDACDAAGFRPQLVAIDTLAASMSGDDSSARDIGRVFQSLRALRDALATAVLVIDHTGWDESRERGSSAKRQAADVVIEARKVGESQDRRATSSPNRSAKSCGCTT